MSTMIVGPPCAGNTYQHDRVPDGQQDRPPLPVRRPGDTLPPDRRGEQLLAALLTDWSRAVVVPSGRRLVAGGWLR